MLSNLDKVIEKIPYFNGGFRRRMTAGTIVIGALLWLLPSLRNLVTSSDFGEAVELLFSPAVLAIILVIVHAAGGIIGVFASLFVSRMAG